MSRTGVQQHGQWQPTSKSLLLEDGPALWWLHGISAKKLDSLPLQLLCSLTTDIQFESR
jgi:hypothetical protein